MLRKFMSYYRNHKRVFILDLCSAFLVSAIDLLFPMATRQMLNQYIPNQDLKMILVVGSALFFIYLVRARFAYFIAYNGHMMGAMIERDMRRDLFRKYEELDYDFYDDHQTGVLMSYLTDHLHDISEMSHHVPEDLFISGVLFIGSFVYLSFINLTLTLIIFAIVIVVVVFSWWRRTKMLEAQRRVRKAHGELDAKIENAISGIRLTKALTNEAYEIGRFSEINDVYADSTKDAYKQMGIFLVGNEFMLLFLNLALLVVGGIFIYLGTINAVDFFTYYLYISFLTKPINRLIQMIQQIQQGMAGFERFHQITSIVPSIISKPDAIVATDISGDIEFCDVSFQYGEEDNQVLKHFSLHVKPGEKVGLIGETGVGKSTISRLIPRFYDVDSGAIKIDGMDVRDLDVYSLRRAIGHVQQDVFIFHGTIRDNILYGNPDATEEEVILAAKKANIHDYIESLPAGYDSITGDKGVRLSGGQKQRVAIARLFLQKPRIVILDEATSSLDNATERLVQTAFDELTKDKTAMVIAHRLSTIQKADRILVLGKDGIMEEGTHEELLSKKGAYWRLVER
ncbi:MAG: ABC transporter ATP-binding protein [Candidatus Izemoplasmatales bacterium]|nr:ABC transporter ATP-binding protein [Candidatus Izemoplasmatales bacterium]